MLELTTFLLLHKTRALWDPKVGFEETTLLDDYLLETYCRENLSRDDYLVYHLGDRGFYAEVTTVARAMIYAWEHEMQLVLDNSEFAYSYREGWGDYFQPFCRTYSPEMESRVRLRSRYGKVDEPRELRRETIENAGKIRRFLPQEVRFGEVSIHGFRNVFKLATMLIVRVSNGIASEIQKHRDALDLPPRFAAIHIRRGDKVGDEDVFYLCDLYLERLQNLDDTLCLFVMSDDFAAVEEVDEYLRRNGKRVDVRTLCTKEHRGFDIWKVRNRELFFRAERTEPENDLAYRRYVYQETAQLLAETLIATEAEQFISTQQSNVGVMVSFLHAKPGVCTFLSKSDLEQAREPS